MKLKVKKTLLHSALLVALSTFSTVTWASLSCIQLLSLQSKSLLTGDPFVDSDRVEEAISLLTSSLTSRFGSNSNENLRLERLLSQVSDEAAKLDFLQEQILEGVDVRTTELQQIMTRLDEIRTSIEAKEADSSTAVSSAQRKLNLDDLIASPQSVVAEKSYNVVLMSGDHLKVIFSDNIVSQIFHDDSKIKVVSRSLRKIQKGLFGWNYAGDGVIRLAVDSSIVEIRASGKDGNFRFFGYLHDGDLHIVHFTISSDHTGAITRRNANNVMTIRGNRGH